VLEVAQKRLDSPPDPDLDRLDLTHLKVYTIDDQVPAIDDGLSWELLTDGRQQLWCISLILVGYYQRMN